MIRTPSYTKQFKKDVKRMRRRGKDPQKLKGVLSKLIAGKPLAERFKDHILIGNYKDRREVTSSQTGYWFTSWQETKSSLSEQGRTLIYSSENHNVRHPPANVSALEAPSSCDRLTLNYHRGRRVVII